MRWLFVFLGACSATIYADHYDSDCDADTDCVRISVGDQCACTCDLAAINQSDYDKYVSDLENIGACNNTCGGDDPDSSFSCGQNVGARCSAGKCVTYVIPDAGTE